MLTFPFGGHIETYSDPSGSFHCHVAFTLWKVSWYKASSIAHCRVCPNTGYSEIPQDLFRIECSMRNGPWWILQKLPYKYIYILLIYIIYIYIHYTLILYRMWHPFLGTPQQLSPSTTLGRLSADKLAVELFTADLAAAPGAAWIHQGFTREKWECLGFTRELRKVTKIDWHRYAEKNNYHLLLDCYLVVPHGFSISMFV